jgi:hypothetical protein
MQRLSGRWDAIAKAVVANGGQVIMQKVTIPTVGRLIFFQDTEGNVAGRDALRCGCEVTNSKPQMNADKRG